MSDLTISKYIKLFEPLSLESKIALLSALTESMKEGFIKERSIDKESLSKELFGAWADIDDDIDGDEIVNSRTISNKEYDL